MILKKEGKITVLGDPFILYNSYLNENLLSEIEEGRNIQWMPFSEYLCFMWKKRAQSKDEIAKIEKLEKQINLISLSLGENSPFSKNIDILYNKSQEQLPEITGGNVAYRFAKQVCSKDSQAVVDISSMYENAQTILSLAQSKSKIPLAYLSFEGTNNISQKERLKSFLCYIPK